MEDLVSVIIPTYKRLPKLKKCIESIKKSTYKNIEIIVVNDDPEVDISEQLPKDIIFLQNKKQSYAALSRNEGAKISKGKFLLFVDDDNIVKRNTIKKLINAFKENKKTGVLGPLMYNKNGDIWFYGAKTNLITFNPKKLNINVLKNKFIETDVVPNFYLVDSNIFKKFKGHDYKRYPMQSEEFEFQYRLKLSGYKNFIFTGTSIIHDYGKLSLHLNPKRLYFLLRSSIFFERDYAPLYKKLIFGGFIIIHMVYYFLVYIPRTNNKKEYYKKYISGLLDGIFNKY